MNDMSNTPKTGIFAGIENDAYHAGPGISKSGLWTIYKKSPAHYKYAPRKDEDHFSFGSAGHIAVLEPHKFEASVMKGPVDRRGNKWTDAEAEAANTKRILLTGPDYEAMQVIRDTIHADPFLSALIDNPHSQVEHSCYWIDPETGVLCRSRDDLYRSDLRISVDLKTAASAHPDEFARSVVNYGYHAQEAWYTDGRNASGSAVDGFVFVVIEKTTPFVTARYELPPSIVEEGRAICRKALARYAECAAADEWPGYSGEITELSFKRWSYQEIDAPAEEAA